MKCHINCAKCEEEASKCTECPTDWKLNKLTNKCVEKCTDGVYENEDGHSCDPCHETCETCTGEGLEKC